MVCGIGGIWRFLMILFWSKSEWPFDDLRSIWHWCVSQLTQASLLQIIKRCKNFFFDTATLRWHTCIKTHEIWTFKVLISKNVRTFLFFFFIEECQFRTTFFVQYIFGNFNFKINLLSKLCLIFGNKVLSQC